MWQIVACTGFVRDLFRISPAAECHMDKKSAEAHSIRTFVEDFDENLP